MQKQFFEPTRFIVYYEDGRLSSLVVSSKGDRELNRKTNSAEGKRSQPKMFYKAFLYKLHDTYQGVYS